MKNPTLEEIMMRSSEAADGGGKSGSGGGGSTNFDMAVPAVVGAVAGTSALAAKAKNDGALDSAALTTAEVSRRTDSGTTAGSSGGSVVADTPSSAASTRATVGEPTPIIPAVEPPSKSPAGGCEYITPAYFAAYSASTNPAAANPATTSSAAASSAGPAALTPRTAAASAATAAAEASSVAVAAAAAASAAAALAAKQDAQSDAPGAGAGGDGAVVVGAPPTTAITTSGAVIPAPSPDTPGSTGSGPQVAAQAKVFQRLCDSSGSETETGDAGGGAAAGSFGEESTLSFKQLMGWDEVQELLEYGALKEEELTTLWQVCVVLLRVLIVVF